MVTDEELMDQYCAGDKIAFETLFSRFRGRLTGFLTGFVGPHQAQDLLQVTFIKIHNNRHRYHSGAKVTSWFFTIARNSALDYLRSAPKRREAFGLEMQSFDNSGHGGRIDLDKGDLFLDDRVRAAVAGLKESQREVILLHWFGGLTFEEVAKVVGAKGSAVRVRAHRAYEKLRLSLGDVHDEASAAAPDASANAGVA